MNKILLSNFAILCICFSSYSQMTFYVDASKADNTGTGTSWVTAKRDLQNAINLAQIGDAIWVKAGIYKPTELPVPSLSSDRDKAFLLKPGVSVFGGFIGTEISIHERNSQTNASILSGDIGVANDNTDNCYHIILDLDAIYTDTLDGFTITQGNANGNNIESIFGFIVKQYCGGGILNASSSRLIQNCNIFENRVGDNVQGSGAGVYADSGFPIYNNCNFSKNITNANLPLFNGGALYLTSSPGARIVNCAFSENEAGSGAGMYITECRPFISHCTLANNTAFNEGAGIYYSSNAGGTLENCILWNNTTVNTTDANREEIFSDNTASLDQVVVDNCLIRDAFGTPLNVQNTNVVSCINNNPLFVNATDPNGVDNIYLTADDGLQLQCNSPAIGLELSPIVLSDILGLPRGFPIDLGAYESGHSDITRFNLPTEKTIVQLLQNPNGISHYSDCNSEIAAIQSGGSYNVAGMVMSTVWIEVSQPTQFVKRHYEITPLTNAASSTAKVTLYFKQAEFDAYNSQIPAPVLKLPINSSDAVGKQNLLIEKRNGTSNDFSGLPNSYTGAITTINPLDANIFWNAIAARWEVSFDVTGFSGFFVKTQTSVLPLRLSSFSATVEGNCTKIQWQTVDEINTKLFEIEYSESNNFKPIAMVQAKEIGNNAYVVYDCNNATSKSFYRIKMMDKDGRITYSQIMVVDRKHGAEITIHPNPTSGLLNIDIADKKLLNTNIEMIDSRGITLLEDKLDSYQKQIDIKNFAKSIYFIRFADGTVKKIIKQ